MKKMKKKMMFQVKQKYLNSCSNKYTEEHVEIPQKLDFPCITVTPTLF